MILLDTDILTLLLMEHPRVLRRFNATSEEIAISVISRIETLRGRFDTLMKAANGKSLQIGQDRLDLAERDLARIPVIPIRASVATAFDMLRENRKLKAIGRADLLIACIALANHATLATRNLKHFRLVPGLKVENWAE